MITKIEIDLIIGILNSVLSMIENIDPDASKNRVFVDVKNAISLLQRMGV